MRPLLASLLVLSTLAGCGVAPAFGPAAPRAGVMGAKKQTNTKAAIIKVPADVFANMEDHIAKLRAKHEDADTKVHAEVTLVASNDGFKRDRRKVTFKAEETAATGTERTAVLGMLNADVPPGEYAYYLVMTGMVVRQGRSRASFDTLEEFYVSDYGRNYRVTLK